MSSQPLTVFQETIEDSAGNISNFEIFSNDVISRIFGIVLFAQIY